MAIGNLQRLKQLEAERTQLLEKAKAETLSQIQGLLDDLAALGEHYEVTPAGKKKSGAKAGRAVNQCTICGFDTIPQHDGRKHRRQKKSKKPFSDKELAAFGLVKA